MNVKPKIWAGLILVFASISYASGDKLLTRKDYEQKIEQQRQKIHTLQQQHKELIELRTAVIDLKSQLFKLKYGSEPNEVFAELTVLKKENQKLTKENQELKVRIENLNEKITGLKKLSRKKSKAAGTSESTAEERYVKDQGKRWSKAWFNRMYPRFCDNIVFVNGKYVMKKALKIGTLSETPAEKGEIIYAPGGCTVLQVLGHNEALIRRMGYTERWRPTQFKEYDPKYIIPGGLPGDDRPAITFHLTGYENRLIDGQRPSFKGYFVCAGTYQYTDTLGAKSSVQSFKPLNTKPLTKEQFAEAVNSGLFKYPRARK